MEGRFDLCICFWCKGQGQDQLNDILVQGVVFCFCSDAIHLKIEAVDIPAFIIIAEIESRTAIFKGLDSIGGVVIFISIGPKMYPDKMKGIRRIIVVIHFDESVQAVVGIIERYIDLIVNLLLPIGSWQLAVGGWQVAVKEYDQTEKSFQNG